MDAVNTQDNPRPSPLHLEEQASLSTSEISAAFSSKSCLHNAPASPNVEALAPQMREAIKNACEILQRQDSNVVFEFSQRHERWLFRRGGIELPLPETLVQLFAQKVKEENVKSVLIAFRSENSSKLHEVLTTLASTPAGIIATFAQAGIEAFKEFKRVLMVPPYGDREGQPLKYIIPHYGVETVALRLRRELPNVDARVYNPNLGSLEDLYETVKGEHFDVIGFSVLMLALDKSLEMIAKVSTVSPQSLKVLGGSDLRQFPDSVLKEMLEALPIDLFLLDDGSSLIKAISQMDKQSNSLSIEKLKQIRGVVIPSNGSLIRTALSENSFVSLDVRDEIPFDKADLTHGVAYSSYSDGLVETFVAPDRIGQRPLSLAYGNMCVAHCIYCSLKKNTQKPPSPQEVIAIIEKHASIFDSINFDSSDFLHDRKGVEDLLSAIEGAAFSNIPKKITARVDSLWAGRALLSRMERAGFSLIAFGIESFDDTVLACIRKGTTRRQNIDALDAVLEARIRPGMNLILFTPWDTLNSTLDTINQALRYIEQGAYVNVVPGMNIIYGTPISRCPDLIEYRESFHKGMRKPLLIPYQGKVLDAELKALLPRVYQIHKQLEGNYQPLFARTVSLYSLLFFKAFLMAAQEIQALPDLDASLRRVDKALENHVAAIEKSVGAGAVFPFAYTDYNEISIPREQRSSSLRIDDYLESKYPGEIVRAIKSGQSVIEIHRGPLSMTYRHLAQLRQSGAQIGELSTDKPRVRKFFSVKHKDESYYIIANSIGPNRELFVSQTLLKYHYPAEQVRLRVFPYDFRHQLLETGLGKYRGQIDGALLVHEIDTLFKRSLEKAAPGAQIIEEFKGDFIDARLLQLPNGLKMLACDIEYHNGEFIDPFLKFLADSPSERGLGIKEILFFGACGGIGEGLNLLDLAVGNEWLRYGHPVRNDWRNGIHSADLRSICAANRQVHEASVFTVPTVLSTSRSLATEISKHSPKGLVELEAAHACLAMRDFPATSLSLVHEIHDKPAVEAAASAEEALGKEAPGMLFPENRVDNMQRLLGYVFARTAYKAKLLSDLKALGLSAQALPTCVMTKDAVVFEILNKFESYKRKLLERPFVIRVAGLSGAGKTNYLTPTIIEALQGHVGAEDILHLVGDRLSFKRRASSPSRAPAVENNKADVVASMIEALAEGKRVAVPLYDNNLRARPVLDASELQALVAAEKAGTLLDMLGVNEPILLASSSLGKYAHLCMNKNSELGVAINSGTIVEVLKAKPRVIILDAAKSMSYESLNEQIDFSVFCWASPQSRLKHFIAGQLRGERMLTYSKEDFELRLQALQADEDKKILPFAHKADLLFLSES